MPILNCKSKQASSERSIPECTIVPLDCPPAPRVETIAVAASPSQMSEEMLKITSRVNERPESQKVGEKEYSQKRMKAEDGKEYVFSRTSEAEYPAYSFRIVGDKLVNNADGKILATADISYLRKDEAGYTRDDASGAKELSKMTFLSGTEKGVFALTLSNNRGQTSGQGQLSGSYDENARTLVLPDGTLLNNVVIEVGLRKGESVVGTRKEGPAEYLDFREAPPETARPSAPAPRALPEKPMELALPKAVPPERKKDDSLSPKLAEPKPAEPTPAEPKPAEPKPAEKGPLEQKQSPEKKIPASPEPPSPKAEVLSPEQRKALELELQSKTIQEIEKFVERTRKDGCLTTQIPYENQKGVKEILLTTTGDTESTAQRFVTRLSFDGKGIRMEDCNELNSPSRTEKSHREFLKSLQELSKSYEKRLREQATPKVETKERVSAEFGSLFLPPI